MVGSSCRRGDTTDRRRTGDNAGAYRFRPRVPQSRRQGRRRDALARATRLNIADADALAGRYKGHRNIRRARRALTLVDAGAESPRETWLRLLVIEAGYPPPQTQIPVYGEYGELVAVVDMGWEDVKIALEYDGDHHRTDRRQLREDIERFEALPELGWITIRVMAEHTRGGILAHTLGAGT
jgi:hypothetical protein